MPQSLSRVYLHVIFSTKNREAYLVDGDMRHSLYGYIAKILKPLDSQAVEIGGVADHVHLLTLFPRTRAIAETVKEVKRVSTNWIQGQAEDLKAFRWQTGYGVFSVSPSSVDEVVGYIRNQEAHHRSVTFQEEYREFLRRHAVEYDERFVWD